jgi:F0F1-type ATP synthase membrane subunit b/b'
MKRLLLLALLCFVPAFAAEEEEKQPPIEYKWLNFAILAAGLGYLIISKGMPALAERGHEIEKALKAAEIIKADAAAEEAAIDRKMAGMKAEIDSMRADAKKEMEAERTRMTAETQSLVAKLQANAESEIASMTKQAQNALSARASELALSLARQKVATRMNAATDAGLITGFVQDLKKLASSGTEARN